MIHDSLQIFVTVVEHSNFSRAAEALHISQPGVSLHIQNLEKELGAKLIHRTPKYVKLTEAGDILYQRAKLMLSLYEEARTQIQLLHEVVTGTIHIGASFTIGEYVLPRLLASFAQLHPQVDVHVTIANTEEIVQKIRSKSLNLGLVEGDVQQPDLDVTYWQEDEMIVIAPPEHPLTRIQQVTTDLLQDQTWVYREPGSGTRAFSDRFLDNYGLRVKRSFMLSSNQGVKEAVIAGLGLAVISRLVVQKELSNGELRELKLTVGRLTRALSILQDREPHEILALHVFRKHLASPPKHKYTTSE